MFSIPRIFNEKLVRLSMWLKTPIVWGYPVVIIVEPTNICGAKCPLCLTGTGQLKREKGYMSIDLFKKIVDESHRFTKRIMLFGVGEPFLNRDIFEMVSYAKAKNMYVIISTNGQVFYDKKNLKKIIDSGLDELVVSFDGLDKKTFCTYRKGIDFEKVKSGVEDLARLRDKKKSKLLILLQFIVMKHNEHQLEEMQEYAKKIGVGFVAKNVSMELVDGVDYSKWNPSDPERTFYKVDNQGKYVRKRKPTDDRVCEIWMSLVVNWNGTVSMCCYDYKGEIELGDLNKESLKSIWMSPKLAGYRRRVLEGKNRPKVCEHCLFQEYKDTFSVLNS